MSQRVRIKPHRRQNPDGTYSKVKGHVRNVRGKSAPTAPMLSKSDAIKHVDVAIDELIEDAALYYRRYGPEDLDVGVKAMAEEAIDMAAEEQYIDYSGKRRDATSLMKLDRIATMSPAYQKLVIREMESATKKLAKLIDTGRV